MRLTTTEGLDDGSDYSPDGRWIYFNSDRSGRMQIWRMNPDGSAMEQLTKDENNNWFAHPSPDGKWIVFLTYGLDVKVHPAAKDGMLRLMPADGAAAVLLILFGRLGRDQRSLLVARRPQGRLRALPTIEVSWSCSAIARPSPFMFTSFNPGHVGLQSLSIREGLAFGGFDAQLALLHEEVSRRGAAAVRELFLAHGLRFGA